MTSNPRFSIVIPTYNREDSIGETLQSCFAQRFGDFEIIVIDDGSTDDTLGVLQAIDDPRLRIVSQQNAGPAAARNHGMRLARAPHIAFLDSDDKWYPAFLETANACLDGDPDKVLYGQIIVDRGVGRCWIKPDRAMRSDEPIYDYLYVQGGFIQTSTMVVPTMRCRAVQWDESVTFGDNDQFAIDLWNSGVRFEMLPEPMLLYADVISDDALSQLPITAGQSPKYTNFFRWMATQRERMSDTAWAGFQARFESVGLARRYPGKSIGLLWNAWRQGAMSVKGMLRQAVQNFAPVRYRKLVDLYVKWRGQPMPPLQG